MDLAGDGGILPLDFRGFTRLYIHGLFLRVGDIALIFQFPQIVAAIFQSLKPDIAPVIAGFLRDGGVAAVIEDEGHAGDALAGDGIDLVEQDAGDGLVGDLQRGGLPIPDLDPVGRIIQTVALGGLPLRHGVPAIFRFGEIDHAVFIGGVGADDLAIHFPDLELDAGDALSGFFVLLNDGKPARADVIKAHGLHLARLDENGFRRAVQHKALHGLDLPRRNGGAGDQVIDNDAAILIGDELSVASAHNSAAAVGHKEGHALQRRRGALNILFNHKSGAGRVGEMQCLGVIGIDHHRLGAAGLVDGVAGNGGRFRHHQRPHHAMDGDFAVLIGEVQAVAADLSVFSGYERAGRGRHPEGHALQGLPGEGIPLVDNQCACFGILDDDRLRVTLAADDHIGGGSIHDIACGGLDLRQHISAGGQIGDFDLALTVGGKNAVLRQGAGADHAVQPHLTSSGSGHTELRAGKGLTGGAVPLLDDELALGLVLEGQADRAALLDLNGLALGINDIAVRRASFCYDDALAGFQAGDADLAVLVRPEDAIGVTDQRAVRVGDLKFRVGEGHAGVHGTDLADQQDAVRGVVKANGDHTLLTAVRQIDRFRGVDDGVPIGRVNLLHDIGAAFQPRPDGGAVLAGDLLPDGRAAGAGGAAQKPQLEGAAGERLMGHAVILLNDDGVQRSILEGQGLALTAVEDDLLGGGFLHLETGSGFHLGHGVFAGIEPLALLMEPDLTLGVCEDISVIDGGRGLGGFAAAGVGDVELGSLDRRASHAVLLVDGELGHFPIPKSDIHLVTGVQADGLLPVGVFAGQVVRSGNRLFCNSVTAGGHAVRHCAILAGGPIGGEITVDALYGEHGAGDGLGILRVDFGDGQPGHFQVFKYEVLIVAGAEVNGLGHLAAHHIGVRDGYFLYLITIHRNVREDRLAVRPGGDVLMIAVMDALDLKDRAGNGLLGLLIQLLDGQIGKLLVFGCYGHGAAAIDGGLIHMGADGGGQLGVRGGGADLHKGVHTLRHMGDCDFAGGVRGLRADQLPVPEDMEYRAGEGRVGVGQLDELDLYLRVILKNERYVRFAVPIEFLTDFAGVLAQRVAVGRRHFFRHIAADGHGIPRHIRECAARSGGIGAGEIVIHTGDLDDCARETSGGIVRVHLADLAAGGDDGSVRKGDRHGAAAVVRQDDIFRTRVVDLVAVRSCRFRYGVGSGVQGGEGIGSIRAGNDVPDEGAVGGFHVEPRPGKTLGGVGGVHLLDHQLVLLVCDGKAADHNALDGAGGVGGRASAGEGILFYVAIAPNILLAQIQNVFRPVPECGTVAGLVDAGIARALQRVPDVHQFLRAGGGGITQGAVLIPPHDGLYPGVHVPAITGIPDVIHAQGVGLVREDAEGVGVVIGHHHFDGGIGDGLRIAPGLADQRGAHAAALRPAEAHGGLSGHAVIHLVHCASAKAGGLIGNTAHAEPL